MPKVYNIRDRNRPYDAVYVGRGRPQGPWGNPFRIGADTREQVISKYEEHIKNRHFMSEVDIYDLRGKDLACHCAPLACHADVLLRLANDEPVGSLPVFAAFSTRR